MHIPSVALLDSVSGTRNPEMFESSCNSGQLSWFKWCPIDIILWVLLAFMVSIVAWKVYSTNRVGPASKSKRSKHKRYFRLTLPDHPGSPEHSITCKDGYDGEYTTEGLEDMTLVDPFHVVNNLDNSLIAKIPDFSGASVPQRVLGQKKTGKLLSGLGLGINMSQRDSPPPPTLRSSSFSEKVSDEREKISTPSPQLAHLHNPRWDT